MGNGRIVDREDLYSLLVGLCRPVYQFLQISEISYSKTFLTTERENTGIAVPATLRADEVK